MRTLIDATILLSKCDEHLGLELVGSQYILGTGADTDMLWHVTSKDEAALYLSEHGYHRDCAAAYDKEGTEFYSFRKADINVIVTSDGGWFLDFLTAAKVCKYLKLTDKEQRKGVHRIVRDGADADGQLR